MSDHIAHLGICDDTLRLAMCHPNIHEAYKRVMAEYRDIAHMGAVTRSADKWSADLILWARQEVSKPEAQRDQMLWQKLAFVLGALTHRAADRLTKPITRCWGGGEDSGRADSEANESKIMQDIFVFKELYAGGEGGLAEPFTAMVLRVPVAEGEAKAEEYFRVLLRRALISMHTISPDRGNMQPWLTAFLRELQSFPKSLSQYAQLAGEWAPAKVKKYLIDKNFYCREDDLIRLARDIQCGSTVPGGRVVEAVAATDKTHSRYARALAKAIDYLLAAGDLFDGRLSLEEAKGRFDVGVPELSLQD